MTAQEVGQNTDSHPVKVSKILNLLMANVQRKKRAISSPTHRRRSFGRDSTSEIASNTVPTFSDSIVHGHGTGIDCTTPSSACAPHAWGSPGAAPKWISKQRVATQRTKRNATRFIATRDIDPKKISVSISRHDLYSIHRYADIRHAFLALGVKHMHPNNKPFRVGATVELFEGTPHCIENVTDPTQKF
ncbi:MAG: hypothetical protein R3F49_20880 [Planctomycetota bacterium]